MFAAVASTDSISKAFSISGKFALPTNFVLMSSKAAISFHRSIEKPIQTPSCWNANGFLSIVATHNVLLFSVDCATVT